MAEGICEPGTKWGDGVPNVAVEFSKIVWGILSENRNSL